MKDGVGFLQFIYILIIVRLENIHVHVHYKQLKLN